MNHAGRIKKRLRALRINRAQTEAQLVLLEGVIHFRADGHAHWAKARGTPEVEAAGRAILAFRLEGRRLVVEFDDGSVLSVRRVWLGTRTAAQVPIT